MTIQRHGDHLIFYDADDSLVGVDLGKPTVSDAYFPEGKGYFENPRLSPFKTLGELARGIAPLVVPVPHYIPAGYRLFGCYAIHTPSGAVCDVAMVFVERQLDRVKLAFSTRPLTPDDGAIKIFITRRPTAVLAYPAVRSPLRTPEAKLVQHPHEMTAVGGIPGVLMRFEADTDGAPLRERQIPNEFITWYDARVGGWISVHSCAVSGEAMKIAEGIGA